MNTEKTFSKKHPCYSLRNSITFIRIFAKSVDSQAHFKATKFKSEI